MHLTFNANIPYPQEQSPILHSATTVSNVIPYNKETKHWIFIFRGHEAASMPFAVYRICTLCAAVV